MFICKLCSQKFESIPDSAIPVGKSHGGYRLFRLTDGTVHDLRKVSTPPANVPAAEPKF